LRSIFGGVDTDWESGAVTTCSGVPYDRWLFLCFGFRHGDDWLRQASAKVAILANQPTVVRIVVSVLRLAFQCSWRAFLIGAGDGIRTRDLNFGKVALCRLSYPRQKRGEPKYIAAREGWFQSRMLKNRVATSSFPLTAERA
jgi:hypothetical protein